MKAETILVGNDSIGKLGIENALTTMIETIEIKTIQEIGIGNSTFEYGGIIYDPRRRIKTILYSIIPSILNNASEDRDWRLNELETLRLKALDLRDLIEGEIEEFSDIEQFFTDARHSIQAEL